MYVKGIDSASVSTIFRLKDGVELLSLFHSNTRRVCIMGNQNP
jgi:hypothetical protein